MECMKHYTRDFKEKKDKKGPNHPVGQQIWPETEGRRRSVEPHSGVNFADSAGLELIFFTLQHQPARDKLHKLDNG